VGARFPRDREILGGHLSAQEIRDVSPAKINGQTEMLFGGRGELVGPKE